MKKLLFIILAGILTSCNHYDVADDGAVYSGDLKFNIFKLGDCQYVETIVGSHMLFSHKGDCNNPIHIYKNEQDTIN